VLVSPMLRPLRSPPARLDSIPGECPKFPLVNCDRTGRLTVLASVEAEGDVFRPVGRKRVSGRVRPGWWGEKNGPEAVYGLLGDAECLCDLPTEVRVLLSEVVDRLSVL
jgi:hypothetical protein